MNVGYNPCVADRRNAYHKTLDVLIWFTVGALFALMGLAAILEPIS